MLSQLTLRDQRMRGLLIFVVWREITNRMRAVSQTPGRLICHWSGSVSEKPMCGPSAMLSKEF